MSSFIHEQPAGSQEQLRRELLSRHSSIKHQLRINRRLELVFICKLCLHTDADHSATGVCYAAITQDSTCLCASPDYVKQGRYTDPLTNDERLALTDELISLAARLHL